MNRRQLLTAALGTPLLAATQLPRKSGTHLRLALNAYSFNRPLTAGTMTIQNVIEFCAEHNLDGVDLTGYYFPGYPKAPEDSFIHQVKRSAFLNGVSISGTGVRNDFALADAAARNESLQLVKNWIDVAAKLGAPIVRVFSGRQLPAKHSFDQVLDWMVPAFQQCAHYGSQRGVLVGLQHHDDFLKTAAETIRLVNAVDSPWFTVILDVGSLRQGDPYEEIEKLIPYSASWQIKEHVWYGEKKVEIDLPRLRRIIEKSGYRGFLPVEALGPGDPQQVVAGFVKKVRAAFA